MTAHRLLSPSGSLLVFKAHTKASTEVAAKLESHQRRCPKCGNGRACKLGKGLFVRLVGTVFTKIGDAPKKQAGRRRE